MDHARRLLLAAGLCASIPLRAGAQATAGSNAPVRFLVPYAPGGTTDVLARLIAARAADVLGRPVVVENRPGASGTIAGALVASSAPDGSTLLVGGMEIATAPSLIPGSSFAATRDLAGVAGLTVGPLVLVVSPAATGARSLQELIAECRAHPGAATFASAGVGNVTHLFGEIFRRSAKIDIRHVPYKGAAAALTDLQSGLVTMMMAGTASVRPFVTGGQLRALAVTGREAAASNLPGIPSFADAGLPMPATDGGAWTALFAPKATPAAALRHVDDAIGAALAAPEVQSRLSILGLAPAAKDPGEVDALLASQTRVWSELIVRSGIKLD